ncbi:hypothetical protein [Algoriphagus sp.]|jgi:hypothetical protein|uniref:hypothetical protein n=1 Tax=Algoriphagus sp. TaxID=1872435 RepID=UPI00271FB517|nr:hypothetical protein [Algoriphagus sp.]MDO8966410.1 hypothetical protein [Algoriphagus sp.]MDP3202357.1 hypothetical protein [Algoriphagus sp.]
MKNLSFSIILCFTFLYASHAQTIPFSKGRIAISSDGNEHDEDDWAATPMSLALLAARGLQDQLVVYTFSDHTWGSNKEKPGADAQMRESAFIGGRKFGFKKTKFIEAVAAPNFAVIELTKQINKSSVKDPLTILAAGPMNIIGDALNEADSVKLKHVRLISHSTWNDEHADNPYEWETHKGWTWAKIEESFAKKGLQLDHITDQNGGSDYEGLKTSLSKYDWLKNSSKKDDKPFQKGSWDWLYSRLEAAQKGEEFDPSDAGMVIYLLTGKQKTSPEDLREILENPGKMK